MLPAFRTRLSALSSQHVSPPLLARFVLTSSKTTTKMAAPSKKGDPPSFTLEDYNDVPVSLAGSHVADLTKDELKEWPPFKNWITTLTKSLSLQSSPDHPFHNDPYQLRSTTIDSYSRFGKRIGFLKISAHVSNSTETPLPGVIFLRGPAVAMLVVLIPDDVQEAEGEGTDKEAYAILTVQPRIATGSLGFVELPAGMMDDNNNFAGVAAREIEEELGMVIKQEELVSLTDKVAEIRNARVGKQQEKNKDKDTKDNNSNRETLPFGMYPSAGGCDEYIKIFFHERRVPRHTLKEWEGKYGGLRDTGEMITLKIVPLEDLWLEGSMDSKALAAVTLYKQYKKWEKQQQQ